MRLSYFFDFQIIFMLMVVIASWKFGDWRNWKLYYPTILFVLVVNFVYNLISYNFPLWQYESPLLKTTGSDLLLNLVAFPAVIILYLTYFNKVLLRQNKYIPLYVLSWVAFYTLTEWFSCKLNFFSYHNGWNIWWSLLFNCIMFPMIWLHHKRPLGAIAFVLVLVAFIVNHFGIPFSSMK